MAKGVIEKPASGAILEGRNLKCARGSVITLVAAELVVGLGLFPSMRPTYSVSDAGEEKAEQVEMVPTIMIVMLAAAGTNMVLFGASRVKAVKGSIMNAGMGALISIAGLGWLGSSFFEGNRLFIIHSISGIVQQHPWVFAVRLFALSVLLASQAATVVTLMPVGIALGLGFPLLIAVFPAANGYFFLPTYATLLAISFDQTGTTRIGRYILNHRFMVPGPVATVSSVVIGSLIAKIVL
jgi:anaerobic C4-dicarboxylate transporter DcuA